MSSNVIAVSFEQDAKAYEALSTLKQLESQGQVGVSGAAVVIRDESGHIVVKDEVSNRSASATATGGFVGLLVGILGGPFGILLFGATGLLIGSMFDEHEVEETESVLATLAQSIRPGHESLLAEVSEQSPEVIDTAMQGLGGTVLRRDLSEVEAEVAAAEDAQREATRQARRELIHARRDQHVERIRAKIDELMGKLHRHHAAS